MRPVAQPSSTLHRPLDMLLGTVASVRVLRVLIDHGGALTPTTIASRARITRQGAWNALARLRGLDIVADAGQGRAVLYRLNDAHPLAPPLEALFKVEAQRVEKLFSAIRDAAARMKPKPIAVWLYGSVARGEDRPDSDFDVAILSPEGEKSRQEAKLAEALDPFFGELMTALSVIAMSANDLRRLRRTKDKMWTNLKRDAVVLYGLAPAEALGD